MASHNLAFQREGRERLPKPTAVDWGMGKVKQICLYIDLHSNQTTRRHLLLLASSQGLIHTQLLLAESDDQSDNLTVAWNNLRVYKIKRNTQQSQPYLTWLGFSTTIALWLQRHGKYKLTKLKRWNRELSLWFKISREKLMERASCDLCPLYSACKSSII